MEPPPKGSHWYEDDGRGTPCAPYPNEVLAISGNRRLSWSGVILTEDEREWHFGHPVKATPRTRAFWERKAAVAGHTLEELLDE